MPRYKITYPKQSDNWRDNLSQSRPTPQDLAAEQIKTNLANARLGQFPLENGARQAALTRAQSAEAKARYEMGKEIETDRQKTAFYNGLQELEANLATRGHSIGTKEHAEAFAAYAHEFPLARSSADVDKTLQLHAKVNDDQAALSQRIQTAIGAVPEGYTAKDITMTSTGQPSIRFASGTPGDKALERYAKLQGMITSHTEGAALEKATNMAANKPNIPYSQAPAFHAAQTEAAMLERQFPGLAQPSTDVAAPTQPAPVAAAGVSPAPQAIATPTPINHSDALDWANANPNDPRAAVILQRAQSATVNPDEGQ